MRSIVEAGTGLDVRAVVSNRPDAAGLEWARSQGISTRVVDHKQFGAREEFDRSLAAVIDEHAPQVILLAVSPDPSQVWTVDTVVDVLSQALMLARVRMQPSITLTQSGHMPLVYLGQRPGNTGISFSL